MSEQFLTEAGKYQPLKGEKGNSRQAVLLVLLGVVAVAGYLYFFTGLIKPREQAAKEPAIQSAQVKQPMPPRVEPPGEKAAPAAKPEETKPAAAKPEETKPATAKPEETKLATAKKEKPAAGPVQSKPAPVQKPKPAEVPAKTETVKTAKAEAPAGAKAPAKAVPPAAAKAQVKGVEKPAAGTAAKKPAAAGPARQDAKPAKKAAAGVYTLKIGEYVVDKEVKAIEAKLNKLGVTPVERHKISKLEPMHRLFYAEFGDHDTALVELQKLQKTVPDAFFVQENDKFVIYAGSYYREGKAAVEQDRLYDKGVKLVMKTAEVSVPIIMLTAGSYPDKNEARKGVAHLKKGGIAATIVKTGKEQE
jgi:sporulation related protein